MERVEGLGYDLQSWIHAEYHNDNHIKPNEARKKWVLGVNRVHLIGVEQAAVLACSLDSAFLFSFLQT